MSEDSPLPALDPDESIGDQADQASRLQEFEESEAIEAARGKEPADGGEVLDPEYVARLTEDD